MPITVGLLQITLRGGPTRPAIRTVSVWATMAKGLSKRTITALQMMILLVYFEHEMVLKKVLASTSSCSRLLILQKIPREPQEYCCSPPP
jgi:hypothetical protein